MTQKLIHRLTYVSKECMDDQIASP